MSAAEAKRVAVVTGANKGIGRAIVKHLLDRGFEGDVFVTARNEDLGKACVAELGRECAGAKATLLFHQLDITDQASVDRLRNFLQATYGGLDVLVNNAGIAYKQASAAPFSEQAEVSVATNYFGTLRVCEALFPLLRPHARVVHVSSSCGHLSKIPCDKLKAKLSSPDLTVSELNGLANDFVSSAKEGNNVEKGWGSSAYNASKVLLTALGFIQQRQFDAEEQQRADVIVNMVHPGYVDTDMTSHKGSLKPEEGADAPAYLAMLPPADASNPRGQYVWYTRKVTPWNSEPVSLM